MNKRMKNIVLASASPRRKELLSQIHMPFAVRVSRVEEKMEGSNPAAIVESLAEEKAEACFAEMIQDSRKTISGGNREPEVADSFAENILVIGADTVVALDGEILGKPGSEEEAAGMLQRLSGRTHEVYTGVCFVYKQNGQKKKRIFHEKTAVTFYPISEQEIADYVATKDPLDKAGSYGIQGAAAAFIKGIKGDYNNVVGLPVGRVYQELKKVLD